MSAELRQSVVELDRAARGTGIPAWKRALDIACIVLALPVVLPVGFLQALYIMAVSPGPVLFKQKRVGYRGRVFMCLKFRTMKVNAETTTHRAYLNTLMKSDQPMKKMDDSGDQRLLPGSRIVRALGLDELPQLINVLNGDMSLVGPRPSVVYEYEQFLPEHRRRCNAAPGLTGLWQVSGKNNTTFQEMIDLDLEYIESMSPLLDLQIMARTIPALLVQAGESRARSRQAGPSVRRPGVIFTRAASNKTAEQT